MMCYVLGFLHGVATHKNRKIFPRYLWLVSFIQGLSFNSRTKVGTTPWLNFLSPKFLRLIDLRS